MSLPELSTPIRLYWDLTPIPTDPPDHEKIISGIIDLRILNLDITATGSTIPPTCFSILEKCSVARLAVTLTVSPSSLTATASDLLAITPPKELLFEVNSIDDLHHLTPLPSSAAGVSFPLCEANWPQIPDVVRFCSRKGFKRLVFPMQRLYKGEVPFHIPAGGLKEISDALSSYQPDSCLKITVHDPFVWRAIFPHTPFPEGRCQAANTMLSIDQEGIAYPCPVMPVPLGNLNEMSLREIAKGELKKAVRARLLSLPGECAGCAEASGCKGGCRGRGERVFGTWEALDPGCR
jgi:radical SAM additional 4Fe4S-binding domain